jgi:hypothetical protein
VQARIPLQEYASTHRLRRRQLSSAVARRKEVIVTGWQWHLDLLHFPRSPGLAGPAAARGNPGTQGSRDTGWRGHDQSRDVLSSSRSVEGASRHHKLKDGELRYGRAAQATNPCPGSCRGRLKNPLGSCHVSYFFFSFSSSILFVFFSSGQSKKTRASHDVCVHFRNLGGINASLPNICCVEAGEGRPRSAFGRVTCTSKCQGEQHTNSLPVPNRTAPRYGAVRLVSEHDTKSSVQLI